MIDHDPPIIDSPLSRTFNRDGITVQVSIFKLEEDVGWTLEVCNSVGTSTVWDDPFNTDVDAFDAFLKAVEIEGMETFLDDDPEGWTTLH